MSEIVRQLFLAWHDFDRVVDGLTAEEATVPVHGGSSFAWTLAHATNSVDAWINVRFQRLPPHPMISDHIFRYGGSGAAEDWQAITQGVAEVRAQARAYLEGLHEDDLDRVISYDGSVVELRATGLRLRDALFINITHHYFHIGEVAAKRALLGHQVGDYPTASWKVPRM